MTSIFWPVIIFSTVVGVASLSIYWYVERPELKKLVSDWFGLNEESVEQLCDKNLLGGRGKKARPFKRKSGEHSQIDTQINSTGTRISW